MSEGGRERVRDGGRGGRREGGGVRDEWGWGSEGGERE